MGMSWRSLSALLHARHSHPHLASDADPRYRRRKEECQVRDSTLIRGSDEVIDESTELSSLELGEWLSCRRKGFCFHFDFVPYCTIRVRPSTAPTETSRTPDSSKIDLSASIYVSEFAVYVRR